MVEVLRVPVDLVLGWLTGMALWIVPTATAQGAMPVVVDLETTNFVALCDREAVCITLAGTNGADAVATGLFEAGKFFAGPEIALPKAKLQMVTKADVVRYGRRTYGFAGPAGSFASLDDAARVVVVHIGELPQASEDRTGIYFRRTGLIRLNPNAVSNPRYPGIPHELFHAVQAVYIPQVSTRWIREATATAAAEAALTANLTERREFRVNRHWRHWAKPLSSDDNDEEYEASEFFLKANGGSLHYIAELFSGFRCLNSAGPINEPLKSYAIMETCPSFELESSYLHLIAVRSTQDYPYSAEFECVIGSNCAGADHLPLAPMAAQHRVVTLKGDEPQCGPGEVRTIQSVTWSLAFTVNAGDPSKYKMLLVDPMSSSLNPTFVSPDELVKLRTEELTAEVDLWVVNHNSQATSEELSEHTYSFVAQRDPVEFTCQKMAVNKWRGEGTVEREATVVLPHDVRKYAASGEFAITLTVTHDGYIRGEGTITATGTWELTATGTRESNAGKTGIV